MNDQVRALLASPGVDVPAVELPMPKFRFVNTAHPERLTFEGDGVEAVLDGCPIILALMIHRNALNGEHAIGAVRMYGTLEVTRLS